MERRCERCGGPLPDGSTLARRYCEPCSAEIHRQRCAAYRLRMKETPGREPIQRYCGVCGKPLPLGCSANKKFCEECSYLRHREMSRQRSHDRRDRKVAVHQQPRTLTVKDERYCARCRYVGDFSRGYLCDYISLTGMQRGCPAGAGCVRREKR